MAVVGVSIVAIFPAAGTIASVVLAAVTVIRVMRIVVPIAVVPAAIVVAMSIAVALVAAIFIIAMLMMVSTTFALVASGWYVHRENDKVCVGGRDVDCGGRREVAAGEDDYQQ